MSDRPTIYADDGHKELMTLNADVDGVERLELRLDGWSDADIGLRLELFGGGEAHLYLKDGTWTVITQLGNSGWMATDIPEEQARTVIEESDLETIEDRGDGRDGEYATIEKGTYEIVSYGNKMPGHTEERVIAPKKVSGRIVETFFEGITMYNILVILSDGQSTIITAPHTDIEDTYVKRSESDESDDDCPQCDDQATEYPETVVEDSAGTHLICPYCERTIKSNVGGER